MKVLKESIESEAFKELRVGQTIVKYFETTCPFESQVEVHSYFSDLYIVLSGNAVVQVSENFSGGEEKGEGEIGNCQMNGHDIFEIHKRDIFLIPFGTSHKLIVDSGGFEQIVLKIPK